MQLQVHSLKDPLLFGTHPLSITTSACLILQYRIHVPCMTKIYNLKQILKKLWSWKQTLNVSQSRHKQGDKRDGMGGEGGRECRAAASQTRNALISTRARDVLMSSVTFKCDQHGAQMGVWEGENGVTIQQHEIVCASLHKQPPLEPSRHPSLHTNYLMRLPVSKSNTI